MSLHTISMPSCFMGSCNIGMSLTASCWIVMSLYVYLLLDYWLVVGYITSA